jgi:riboflavin kinase/FMN adenylyltransferase
MQLFTSLADVPQGFGPSAVTIGKFDGVHAGHRAVIAKLRAVASEQGLTAAVVTFDRHPLRLLDPAKCPDSLVSNAQKVELLATTGVDATLMLSFDLPFSQLSPQEFVSSILVRALGARIVFVGADFRFGAKGAGNVEVLRELGVQHGFEVRTIDEVDLAVESGADVPRRASSTWIRELLETGNVEAASELLERLPAVRSFVVHGKKRGRELGYPTANLSPDIEGFIPADGVYAAWATVSGQRFGAAVSIGNNPTFEGVPQKQIEAHLLDVTIDVYDEPIVVEFVSYVRSMTKFDSIDELITQMNADEDSIRVVLGYPPRPADARAPRSF